MAGLRRRDRLFYRDHHSQYRRMGGQLSCSPGNWMMVLVLIALAWFGPQEGRIAVGLSTVILAAVLAAVGEGIEFAASALGARASWCKSSLNPLCNGGFSDWCVGVRSHWSPNSRGGVHYRCHPVCRAGGDGWSHLRRKVGG